MTIYFLKLNFIEKFLRKKAPQVSEFYYSLEVSLLTKLDRNEFKILKIIFNLTLVFNPHVCLLGMLFYIKDFKTISKIGPVLDCQENLYNFQVLNGLKQQGLKLKDKIQGKFVFYKAVQETVGY